MTLERELEVRKEFTESIGKTEIVFQFSNWIGGKEKSKMKLGEEIAILFKDGHYELHTVKDEDFIEHLISPFSESKKTEIKVENAISYWKIK